MSETVYSELKLWPQKRSIHLELRLHKPVSDWLQTLPQNIRAEYVREIPIGHNRNGKK